MSTIGDILIPLLLLSAAWYTINGLILYYGLRHRYPTIQHTPFVSVLIAARNEEEHLPDCLNSLAGIDYPHHLCEVMVLNDHSADRTMDIANHFASAYEHIHAYDISGEKDGLHGKMNVLSQGLAIARGEFILITDADCVVPPSWIKEFVSYFTESVGMVGGLTVLKGERLLERLQAYDWVFLQSIASGTTGSGKPVTILGNNFAFRRKAYDDVGGFRKIGFSLTEDMALMKAILKNTSYKILYPLEKGHRIWSVAEQNIRDVYVQRLRWLSGGRQASIWGYSLMISAFVFKVAIIISLLLGQIKGLFWLSVLLMLGIDFILPWTVLCRVGLKRWMLFWPLFQIYYILYSVVFGIVFWIPQKVDWKKRTYRSTV